MIFFVSSVRGQVNPAESTGKTRTCYVVADEVNWDYPPSGRDEAMGIPFDDHETRPACAVV